MRPAWHESYQGVGGKKWLSSATPQFSRITQDAGDNNNVPAGDDALQCCHGGFKWHFDFESRHLLHENQNKGEQKPQSRTPETAVMSSILPTVHFHAPKLPDVVGQIQS